VTERRNCLQFINKRCGVTVYNDNRRKGAARVTSGYANLRVGIINQAIYDYKQALAHADDGKIRHFEKWFLGEWGEALSGGNGAYIIEKVRKEMNK
jgi:hypothetical protein